MNKDDRESQNDAIDMIGHGKLTEREKRRARLQRNRFYNSPSMREEWGDQPRAKSRGSF